MYLAYRTERIKKRRVLEVPHQRSLVARERSSRPCVGRVTRWPAARRDHEAGRAWISQHGRRPHACDGLDATTHPQQCKSADSHADRGRESVRVEEWTQASVNLWRTYFFFGPLFSIGGFGAALLVLLPPFLDISSSSRVI